MTTLTTLTRRAHLSVFQVLIRTRDRKHTIKRVNRELNLRSAALSFRLDRLGRTNLIAFHHRKQSFSLRHRLYNSRQTSNLSRERLLQQQCRQLHNQRDNLQPKQPISKGHEFRMRGHPTSRFRDTRGDPSENTRLFPLPSTAYQTAILSPAYDRSPSTF